MSAEDGSLAAIHGPYLNPHHNRPASLLYIDLALDNGSTRASRGRRHSHKALAATVTDSICCSSLSLPLSSWPGNFVYRGILALIHPYPRWCHGVTVSHDRPSVSQLAHTVHMGASLRLTRAFEIELDIVLISIPATY